MWDRRANLVEVHDGDTVRMFLDQGENDFKRLWVRLKDVQAPELSQTGGVECKQFVEDWFAARHKGEWSFIVVTERTETPETHDVMSFARYVGTVYVNENEQPGECLNTAIQAYIDQQGFPPGE